MNDIDKLLKDMEHLRCSIEGYIYYREIDQYIDMARIEAANDMLDECICLVKEWIEKRHTEEK